MLHCVSIPTIPAKHNDLDLVLIRENTEGEYSGLEHESVQGIVESLKVYFTILFFIPWLGLAYGEGLILVNFFSERAAKN